MDIAYKYLTKLPAIDPWENVDGVLLTVYNYLDRIGNIHINHAVSCVRGGNILYCFNAHGTNEVRALERNLFKSIAKFYKCNRIIIYTGPNLQKFDTFGSCVGYASNFIVIVMQALKRCPKKLHSVINDRSMTTFTINDKFNRFIYSELVVSDKCKMEAELNTRVKSKNRRDGKHGKATQHNTYRHTFSGGAITTMKETLKKYNIHSPIHNLQVVAIRGEIENAFSQKTNRSSDIGHMENNYMNYSETRGRNVMPLLGKRHALSSLERPPAKTRKLNHFKFHPGLPRTPPSRTRRLRPLRTRKGKTKPVRLH